MKLSFKKIATTATLTLALGAGIPTAPAFAISSVDCGDHKDFLRITENYRTDRCWANAGDLDFSKRFGRGGMWVSKISTGNNDIWWKADGTWHRLGRWHDLTFPTVGTVQVQAVQIS